MRNWSVVLVSLLAFASVVTTALEAQTYAGVEAGGLQELTFAEPAPGGTTTTCMACGGTYRVATTNGVPTTINNPKNCGDSNACKLTLKCVGADGNQVGEGHTMSPGETAHSFSCGAAAVKISVACDTSGDECKLCYTTPGAAAVDNAAQSTFLGSEVILPLETLPLDFD